MQRLTKKYLLRTDRRVAMGCRMVLGPITLRYLSWSNFCKLRPECTQRGSHRSRNPRKQKRQQCLSPAVVPRNHPMKKEARFNAFPRFRRELQRPDRETNYTSRLKKSNKTQQYADVYLLLNYSICFGRPSYPSSGVHKTVVAASATDHTIWGARFFRSLLPR